MTMLDRMRRHKSWLKWSLAIVVVSFVLLYIPSFLSDAAQGAAGNSVVADVEGREITAAQFRRVYQQQMQAYRQSYGANVDDGCSSSSAIDQRIVQQMIQEEASLAEAKRLGIKASDAEVRERILALPAFQENGQFIGDQRYRAAAADAEPADASRRVRGPGPPQHRRREAAGRAHRLDDRRRQGRRRRVQEAQRAGQGRRSPTSPPTSSARGWSRPTPRSPSTSRTTRSRTASARSARSAT